MKAKPNLLKPANQVLNHISLCHSRAAFLKLWGLDTTGGAQDMELSHPFFSVKLFCYTNTMHISRETTQHELSNGVSHKLL